MARWFSLVLVCCAACSTWGGEVLWSEKFDAPNRSVPAENVVQEPGRGGVLRLAAPAGGANPGRTIGVPLPAGELKGKRVFLGADVRAANVSRKPNPWNGIKAMLVISTASGVSYPQPEIPDGTLNWQRYSTSVDIPPGATNILLVLGLENVSGEVWFDNISLRSRPAPGAALKPDPNRTVFRGHTLPRLRGAMAGTALTEEDVRHFAREWKGNLLRLQIFEATRQDRALATYDAWLDDRLEHIDRMLAWCEKHGVMAVLDLHSPPGGEAFSVGYVTARGRIFTQPEAQAKFVAVWEKMARRYKGQPAIWGFDLVNEPDDSMLSETCLDWNSLADRAARAIRAIDPDRTLIVEPNQWGGPDGFNGFQPLDLPGIVYSFHFYVPSQFTHQGIHQNPAGLVYPGRIKGQDWDKAALERAMQPAIDFARKYRVHMYVGEFSAIRTAPAGSAAAYLADVIDIFEKHGWDWSYHAYREWHGWSLEHEGTLDQPVKAKSPTDRQKVVTGWLAKNQPAPPKRQP